MSDMTDLNPVLKLLDLKNSDIEEYKKTLKGIQDVTRDLIGISIELAEEQREKQQADLKVQMKKEQEEAKSNEKTVRVNAKIDELQKPKEESK